MLEELTSCNFRLEHFLKSFDILRIKLNPNKQNKLTDAEQRTTA